MASAKRSTTWAAFALGLPMGIAILLLIHRVAPEESPVRRYVHNPVEGVEVILFCCALATLGTKLWRARAERAACRAEVLPPWDGKAVAAGEAEPLLSSLCKLPRRWQGTYLVRRVAAVLEYLTSRGSANQLDDHLRSLTDTDAVALEGSYGLTRFITWAIPILGFLGTVLGITQAISGVTPEKLESDLSYVTDGLAMAFDTTALGLALTMITMFVSFIVERTEQGILDAVDRYADQELAHRFEHTGADGEEFVGALKHQTQVLVKATDQVVQRQAEIWARTFQEMDSRRADVESKQQERFTKALEAALERTLETHTRRLAAMEKQALEQSGSLTERLGTLAAALRDGGREQQAALTQVAQMVTNQVEALGRLQEGEQHLLRLQETLNHNLESLAGAGSFEQAVHSLTAAIHLLTTRAAREEVKKGPSLRLAGQMPTEKGAA